MGQHLQFLLGPSCAGGGRKIKFTNWPLAENAALPLALPYTLFLKLPEVEVGRFDCWEHAHSCLHSWLVGWLVGWWVAHLLFCATGKCWDGSALFYHLLIVPAFTAPCLKHKILRDEILKNTGSPYFSTTKASFTVPRAPNFKPPKNLSLYR